MLFLGGVHLLRTPEGKRLHTVNKRLAGSLSYSSSVPHRDLFHKSPQDRHSFAGFESFDCTFTQLQSSSHISVKCQQFNSDRATGITRILPRPHEMKTNFNNSHILLQSPIKGVVIAQLSGQVRYRSGDFPCMHILHVCVLLCNKKSIK